MHLVINLLQISIIVSSIINQNIVFKRRPYQSLENKHTQKYSNIKNVKNVKGAFLSLWEDGYSNHDPYLSENQSPESHNYLDIGIRFLIN